MIRMDFSETKPVHVRIEDDIKKLILSRAVQPGDVLPSVRETSSKKAMNPETVHRAYRKLCEDGWLTETDVRYVVSSFVRISETDIKDDTTYLPSVSVNHPSSHNFLYAR